MKPCDDKKNGINLPCHDYGNQWCYGHLLFGCDKGMKKRSTRYMLSCPYQSMVDRYQAAKEAIGQMGMME